MTPPKTLVEGIDMEIRKVLVKYNQPVKKGPFGKDHEINGIFAHDFGKITEELSTSIADSLVLDEDKLKQYYQANLLDGDFINDCGGAMVNAKEAFDVVVEAIANSKDIIKCEDKDEPKRG